MLKFFFIAALCFLVSVISSKNPYPEKIKTGIFNRYNINGFAFSALEGDYYILNNNGKIIKAIEPYEQILIEALNDKISIVFGDDTLLTNSIISISGKSFKNTFVINPSNDSIAYRIYDDDLIIKNNNPYLTIINHVPFENYIAAVVQSESGYGRHPEYYNLQATISRTYAVKNLNRHKNEGFELCDEVHCQAYYNKTLYPPIIFATEYTRGDIIIGENGHPINTVFHANCGGSTLNSENVWINASSYLKSVTDTFCLNKPGAKWEKTIPRELLIQYLQNNLGKNFNDTLADNIFNFTQLQRKFFLDPFEIIHLSKFRTDFELRSTFFDIVPTGDSLLIKGRGYGHGVGLCQEGAMGMAEEGISRDSIIRFYYKNAKLKVLD